MADYRLIVTASRNWSDWRRIWGALQAIADQVGPENLVIVHGACPEGGDRHAENFGRKYGIRTEPHPAAWRPGGVYDPGAGFRRNASMVASGGDMCFAWIAPCVKRGCRQPQPHGSHGATHCSGLTEKAGIETRRWFADDDR